MLKGRIVSGKIVSILLAVTMMAGCILTGCGSGESGGLGAGGKEAEAANGPAAGKGEGSQDGTSGKPAEVSVIIETFDNTFASFVMNAMKKYEEEHKDKIHITYLDSKQDANTQISQVENQILNGTQAIICLAVDAKQSEPIGRACKEAGVPLIAFNRIFENCDSFVGADGAVAGSLLARFTGEKTGGKGNVAIVNGIMGQENQFIRRDAIVETLGEMYPDMQVVIEGAGDWKRDKALQLVETWLQSGTDIDAILCLNDDMAMGTQLAVEQAGRSGDIIVCGVNGDPDGINAVRDGKIAATVFQNPDRQAEEALEAALQYIHGEKPESKIMIPFELVTADNVDDYVQYSQK